MNENHRYPEKEQQGSGPQDSSTDNHIHDTENTAFLEQHIARILHEQAQHVHFTPTLRNRILQQLPLHHHVSPKRTLKPILAIVAILLLILSFALYKLSSLLPLHPQAVSVIAYNAGSTLKTPSELANAGQLVSLDPTGQHIVYIPQGQPGVMYTTNLSNPIADNVLAMREARDVAWSPDGSALVTTIYPANTYEPLLALVPTGKYMYLLGHDALAASWLPTSTQEITYVVQDKGQTQLWSLWPQNRTTQQLATIAIPSLVQRLYWSPDGHFLVLQASTSTKPSPQTLNGAGQALYLMNMQTHHMQQIVIPGNFTLGNVTWSPNGQMLTYAQIDAQGHTTLVTYAISTQRTLFTLAMQHPLPGWTWSPNSNTLLYSDGGTLHTHTLHGNPIALPSLKTAAYSPFWLPNGRILYMQVTHDVGQLAWLVRR